MIIKLKPNNNVPTTIEKAVQQIISSCSEKDLEFIRNNPSASVHFDYGMGLRNNWGLWKKDSPLKLDAIKTYNIAHADDISGLILEWVFEKIKTGSFDPIEHCKIYHEHWKKLGYTSLEAGGVGTKAGL